MGEKGRGENTYMHKINNNKGMTGKLISTI